MGRAHLEISTWTCNAVTSEADLDEGNFTGNPTDQELTSHFSMDEPRRDFSVQVRVDWSHWHCGCGIMGSAEDLVREGINGSSPASDTKKLAVRYKAARAKFS